MGSVVLLSGQRSALGAHLTPLNPSGLRWGLVDPGSDQFLGELHLSRKSVESLGAGPRVELQCIAYRAPLRPGGALVAQPATAGPHALGLALASLLRSLR